MTEESRAVEQKYGYIPCLHAANWKATVLDVLRGTKPDYPAGASVRPKRCTRCPRLCTADGDKCSARSASPSPSRDRRGSAAV